jgi:hypothetical protein
VTSTCEHAPFSFDHLVGAPQERFRDSEADLSWTQTRSRDDDLKSNIQVCKLTAVLIRKTYWHC